MAIFDLTKEKYSQMVDIESTSLLSTCGIIQIGACRYNVAEKKTFDHLNLTVDLSDLYKYECFEHDPETLAWWKNQSPEVKKAVLTGKMPIASALTEFENWVDRRYSICAYGYLDLPSLQYAFKKVLGHKEPWNHNKVLDLRTLLLLSGGYQADEKSLDRETKHIALADAISQCEVIFDLLGEEERTE